MVFQKGNQLAKGNKHNLGRHHTKEAKLKIGLSSTGRKHSKETKLKISKTHTGMTASKEAKYKMSKIPHDGINNPNWQGGITSLNIEIRNSFKYRAWRFSVYTRDNYTCQECKKTDIYLHAHHIKYFSTILKENNIQTLMEAIHCNELWNIDNGITLCKKCHKQKHTTREVK